MPNIFHLHLKQQIYILEWSSFSTQDNENQTPTQTQVDKDDNEGKISFYVKVGKNKKFNYF